MFPQLAESEDAGFDGPGAIEAPAVFGDALRRMRWFTPPS